MAFTLNPQHLTMLCECHLMIKLLKISHSLSHSKQLSSSDYAEFTPGAQRLRPL